MIRPPGGLLLSLKKEALSDTCHNTHGPGGHNAELNKPDTRTNVAGFHSQEVPRGVRLSETDSTMGAAGAGGRELMFNSHNRVSVWEDGTFWRQMQGVELHNNVNVLKTTEWHSFKNG